MTEVFRLFPVLSATLMIAAVATVGLAVWAGFDSSPRRRDGRQSATLDELLGAGRHR